MKKRKFEFIQIAVFPIMAVGLTFAIIYFVISKILGIKQNDQFTNE